MNRLRSIEGVYDRMGKLATIDPKYDIAVSSVAVGKLSMILVDNIKVAERCVQMLKKYNLRQ